MNQDVHLETFDPDPTSQFIGWDVCYIRCFLIFKATLLKCQNDKMSKFLAIS